MVLKKPGTASGQRNQTIAASNTIDNVANRASIGIQNQINQMNNPNHHIVVQQMQNTGGSMEGSRPQSAIKKKSNGISPNSKAKQLHLINSMSGKMPGTGK